MHSFDVVAALSPDLAAPGSGPFDDFPTEQRFTLRLETVPDGLRGIVGRAGDVAEIRLTSRGDGTYAHDSSTSSATMLSIDRPLQSCHGANAVGYEHIELRLEQTGSPPVIRVVGLASGSVRTTGGDVIHHTPFVATFEGSLDTTPPSYRTRVLSAEQHVLDEVVVEASEPLPGGTALMLDGVGGLVPDAGGGSSAVARFRTNDETLLPWGALLSLSFEPSFTDLAGNTTMVPSEPPSRTIADPGMLTPDGFESELHAWSGGDVRIVSAGRGALEPITGNNSLFIGPGPEGRFDAGRFTARVPVPAGATTLRARFRRSGGLSVAGYGPYVRVFSPNAGADAVVSLPNVSQGELEARLPAGTADEVVIDIDNNAGCGGLPPPPTGLLIDDLRVE